MARKKDLQGAITRGVDLMFSANDEQAAEAPVAVEAQDTQEAVEQEAQEAIQVHEAKQAYKAQDVTPEALTSAIADMEAKIEAAEARRTQGRKGFQLPRLNITLTPSGVEYVRVMAGITGKSVTRYISDIVDRDAAANAERYQKAKELMQDAR